MNGLHGIIFSYEQEPGLRELAERRMPASIPFGGRYRVVDFMLSNLHAAGITDVGVVLHGNYQSLLDHIGNGKTLGHGAQVRRAAYPAAPSPIPAPTAAASSAARWRPLPASAHIYRGYGRTTSCSPTATSSSICRSRTCLPRIWRAARTSPPSARRTAASWTTRPTSRSRATARSGRSGARRPRRAATARWRSTFSASSCCSRSWTSAPRRINTASAATCSRA